MSQVWQPKVPLHLLGCGARKRVDTPISGSRSHGQAGTLAGMMGSAMQRHVQLGSRNATNPAWLTAQAPHVSHEMGMLGRANLQGKGHVQVRATEHGGLPAGRANIFALAAGPPSVLPGLPAHCVRVGCLEGSWLACAAPTRFRTADARRCVVLWCRVCRGTQACCVSRHAEPACTHWPARPARC